MSADESRPSAVNVRLIWAGVFISGLVVTDGVLKLFCSSWPLVLYLVLGGLGAALGSPLDRRFSGATRGVAMIRAGAKGLSIVSALGLVALFILPVNWETHCSWRHCGRALGLGLFESPFPVGTPPCRGWNKCVNEYPYSDAQYRRVLRQMQRQDCPAP